MIRIVDVVGQAFDDLEQVLDEVVFDQDCEALLASAKALEETDRKAYLGLVFVVFGFVTSHKPAQAASDAVQHRHLSGHKLVLPV